VQELEFLKLALAMSIDVRHYASRASRKIDFVLGDPDQYPQQTSLSDLIKEDMLFIYA
jgi:hypothetical protein